MAVYRTGSKGELENVRVVIRVRPLNKKELTEGYQNIVTIDPEGNVIGLIKPNLINEKPKAFKFDHIFPPDCTQVSYFLYLSYYMHIFPFSWIYIDI